MKASTSAVPSGLPAVKLSTDELAGLLRVKPQTVRAGFCRKSNYLGLRPVKLPNGMLRWDLAEAERLLSGKEAA